MDKSSMRDLAKRLLEYEATSSRADEPVQSAEQVWDKLRIVLTRFAGADGFTSLMRRAVALARAEYPFLALIMVRTDGSISGLEDSVADPEGRGVEVEGAVSAVTAHVLVLLEKLIGETLTLRLVRDAWPEIAVESVNSTVEEI